MVYTPDTSGEPDRVRSRGGKSGVEDHDLGSARWVSETAFAMGGVVSSACVEGVFAAGEGSWDRDDRDGRSSEVWTLAVAVAAVLEMSKVVEGGSIVCERLPLSAKAVT